MKITLVTVHIILTTINHQLLLFFFYWFFLASVIGMILYIDQYQPNIYPLFTQHQPILKPWILQFCHAASRFPRFPAGLVIL